MGEKTEIIFWNGENGRKGCSVIGSTPGVVIPSHTGGVRKFPILGTNSRVKPKNFEGERECIVLNLGGESFKIRGGGGNTV